MSHETQAFYFEQWRKTSLEHIGAVITGENTERNRELLTMRGLIDDATAYVSEQLKAA